MTTKYDYLVKCILVGEAGVGKSSILTRLQRPDKDLALKSPATVGIDFGSYVTTPSRENSATIPSHGNSSGSLDRPTYKMQIWDCAGQTRFNSIVRSYFRGANIVMYVFDLTDPKTLQEIPKWNKMVDENIDQPIIKTLIGNKLDLQQHIHIEPQTAQEIADKIGAEYIEASAKTLHHITLAFDESLLRVQEAGIKLQRPFDESVIRVHKSSPTIDDGGEGCMKCYF